MTSRIPAAIRAARALAASYGVRTLTTGALLNPKVAKSAAAAGTLTLPLHLAPANTSGALNVCPHAGACAALCLNFSGNPAYATGKERARINRTRFFADHRAAFLLLYAVELAAHVAAARRAELDCAARPNATSDLLWERFALVIDQETAVYLSRRAGVAIAAGSHANIMSVFPMVHFYDYTKVPARHRVARLPANYSLTYSFDPANRESDLLEAIDAGMNVAVPFQGRALPTSVTLAGRTLPVLDGDAHDFRPVDPRGHVVGLKFKRITSAAIAARIGRAAARTGEGFALKVAA